MVIEGVRFFPSTTLLHCNVYRWVESKNSLSLSLLSGIVGACMTIISSQSIQQRLCYGKVTLIVERDLALSLIA